MRVAIDAARCQGHGRCYELAPEVFAEDEDGYGVVRTDGDVPDQCEEDVRLADLNCPEAAVVVTR